MTTSPTADDLYKYIGMAFEQAKSDPKLVQKLSGTPGVLKVIATEPDGCIVIDLPGVTAVPSSPDDEADATLRMSSDFANRFWQGDLNLLMAVTRGEVVLEGKMALIAKAVPAAKELFPIYIELLKSDGRTDLLVK
ncbi:SCP2 sterol-binding domain-containing protein [Hoyosella subflava]|uniref:SCP2 domain-containing protein n=1 Tax=Hoyosella subflava (strain DSM 45089 / JCM 17490 / NBRC 109087 / DQS3-9A1) TaxID=443218 RepID=F6EQF0_HOYSD|nr:SCP2 sterol-binding domain-containing protein [Hoyosella subflava]AEF40635.1 hypothetical protein AS9A_2186 [Hoyosella subflava DQS3-9A1]